MIQRAFCRLSAALAAALFLALSQAQAQWTITTYYRGAPNPPQITSMAIADQYFTGALPSRFVGTSTVTQVDLFQNGANGQFLTNNPFPGLDSVPTAGDTDDFVARVTGTLVVAAPGATYHFFTDSDDGNRFRLDINQNGTFQDATESIVPDGGLQGANEPGNTTAIEQSDTLFPGGIVLAAGNYNFEASMFERGGGGSIDVGYTRGTSPTRAVLGASGGPGLGISLLAPAAVRTVGAAVGPLPPEIVNFAAADALRTAPQAPGFPQSGIFDTYNLVDSGGDGDFPGGAGVPGLGAAGANDDNDFVAVGRGILVVPAGGITGAVFRSNTDDGGRLLIDVNKNGLLGDPVDVIINDNVLAGPHNFDSAPVNLTAGRYAIEYSWFERGGGGEGEVSVRLSPTGVFTLLGDNAAAAAGTGLDVLLVPEPNTIVLLGLCMFGLAGLVRKRG
jgi:hypothetical protein